MQGCTISLGCQPSPLTQIPKIRTHTLTINTPHTALHICHMHNTHHTCPTQHMPHITYPLPYTHTHVHSTHITPHTYIPTLHFMLIHYTYTSTQVRCTQIPPHTVIQPSGDNSARRRLPSEVGESLPASLCSRELSCAVTPLSRSVFTSHLTFPGSLGSPHSAQHSISANGYR